MLFLLKTLSAAVIIATVSWLSGQKTALAGFLTALPLTTILALGFSHLEYQDSAQSVAYAKSILLALPASSVFFLPFLIAQRFELSFWSCYISGISLLVLGYLVHSQLSAKLW